MSKNPGESPALKKGPKRRGFKSGHSRKGYIPGAMLHNKMVAFFGSLFADEHVNAVILCLLVKHWGNTDPELLMSALYEKIGDQHHLTAHVGQLTSEAIRTGDVKFFERLVVVMKHPGVELFLSLPIGPPKSHAELSRAMKQASHPIAACVIFFLECYPPGQDAHHYEVREYVSALLGDFDRKTYLKTYRDLGVKVELGNSST